MYEFEKKKLYALLGESLVEELKGYPVYIAGGTITSLFCNREVNDFDIYFKSEGAFVEFVTSIWGDGWVVSSTNKASLVKTKDDTEFQMIHFKYFQKAEDIFETFDFTVCMGAFDFETEQFILHPEFLQHNSQRILKYNKKTAFPLVSLLRVQKYKEKGYKISKPEFIRIALSCMDLEINTYEELKEQMGGMYGVNYDKLFKDKEGKVDLQEAIDVIADLVLDDDYFKTPEDTGKPMGDLDEFLENITTAEIPYVIHNGITYRVKKQGLIKSIRKPKRGKHVDIAEVFKGKKLYKFVNKRDGGRYFSFYDKGFEYVVGQEAVARGSTSMSMLYFNERNDINRSSYFNEKNKVLLEVEFNPHDLVGFNSSSVTLKKCTPVREVPEEEWQKYKQTDDDDWSL